MIRPTAAALARKVVGSLSRTHALSCTRKFSSYMMSPWFRTTLRSGLQRPLILASAMHLRRNFMSGASRLERLQQAAYSARMDPTKQAAYIRELGKVDPYQAKRYFEGLPPSLRTEEVSKEYLKALIRISEGGATNAGVQSYPSASSSLGGAAPYFGSPTAPTTPSHLTLNVSQPVPVTVTDGKSGWFSGALSNLSSIIFIVGAGGLLFFIFFGGSNASDGGTRGSMFGLSTSAHRRAEKVDVTFNDVKGCDEAKQELIEVVEYLKDPVKFSRLGAKLPKGVLLSGPPGTGKTLLARAVAGEAQVPFFFCSGSEFDEMLVGVGTRRLKTLFNEARAAAPAIIFIDEIDALGFSRKQRYTMYKESTLNQLLTELDGFKPSDGVILIGATNLAESLDEALTRPGRFDKEVTVPVPDRRGREELFQLYLSKITAGPDVDPLILARRTTGFTGAQISNMINIAATKATLKGADHVGMSFLEEAMDQLILGLPGSADLIDEETLRKTAYHEGGHALVGLCTTGSHPLHKVTILPRGHAAGVTSFIPEDDSGFMTKEEALAHVAVAMGGRVAEELLEGKLGISNGATADFKAATRLARQMVMRWGMSDRAGCAYRGDPRSEHGEVELSSETRRELEQDVDSILASQYEHAKAILNKHREELDRLADALLEHETLSKEEVLRVIKGEKIVRPSKPPPAPQKQAPPEAREGTAGRTEPHPLSP